MVFNMIFNKYFHNSLTYLRLTNNLCLLSLNLNLKFHLKSNLLYHQFSNLCFDSQNALRLDSDMIETNIPIICQSQRFSNPMHTLSIVSSSWLHNNGQNVIICVEKSDGMVRVDQCDPERSKGAIVNYE